MCGIAGLLNYHGINEDSSTPFNIKAASALISIERRGPDDCGEWDDGICWLGHRRLSVVDLTASGHQPMQRGNLIISFNGMIYNFAYLRERLMGLGHKFWSKTDTEVILAGWQEWGVELLPRLNGMFAIAIWDTKDRVLTLARDRFGKKPIFWRHWKGGIAFGSRLDTVEALTERGQLSDTALAWLLTLKYIPEPLSAVDDINKIPAGHTLEISLNGTNLSRWYKLEPAVNVANLSLAEQTKLVRHSVIEAVEDRLVADVPVACFLSGGIDSAIIASAARQSRKIDSFTVGLEMGDGSQWLFDEREDARETAMFLDTKHHETVIRPNEALEQIDRLFCTALDEPFGDASALPSMMVASAMRQQATVALSGDGADEVFGGYRKYQGELLVKYWQNMPKAVQQIFIHLISILPSHRKSYFGEGVRIVKKFLSGASLGPHERHAAWMAISDHSSLEQAIGTQASLISVENLLRGVTIPKTADPLTAVLLRDIAIILCSDMLTKVDRTSMEVGLEVRSPFLDHRVVETALSIDGRDKIKLGKGKHILRKAFQNDLPSNIFNRPKKGFEIPLARWLKTEFSEWTEIVLKPTFLEELGINPQMEKLWKKQLNEENHKTAELVWTLLSIHKWKSMRQ